MTLRLSLCASFALAFAPAFSQVQAWEKPIAPGLTYRQIVDPSVPRIVHILRWNPGSPTVRAVPELAGPSVFDATPLKGRGLLSEHANAARGIAAINGDFFPGSGDPLGLMVREGELISDPGRPRAAMAWGPQTALFGIAKFTGRVIINEGPTFELAGVNTEVPLNGIVLNTPSAGYTLGKTPLTIAVLRLDRDRPGPSTTLTGTVDLLMGDPTTPKVEPGTVHLVAQGTSAPLLTGLAPGTRVQLELRTDGFDWEKVENAIGGGPTLVKGGRPNVDWEAQGFKDVFSLKRHPRTAVGRNAAGELLFVAVDGRQKMSDGATLDELARILVQQGCVDAINLDGGGSTLMWVFGNILNRPSDGKERPVANGIVFSGPSQLDGTPNLRIVIAPKGLLGQPLEAKVLTGRNETVPNLEVFWGASGAGWIDQGGRLTPLAPGTAEVVAAVRGRVVRATVTIEAPPAPKVAPKAAPSRSGPRRNRRGG